jgi:hypothetical protein
MVTAAENSLPSKEQQWAQSGSSPLGEDCQPTVYNIVAPYPWENISFQDYSVNT